MIQTEIVETAKNQERDTAAWVADCVALLVKAKKEKRTAKDLVDQALAASKDFEDFSEQIKDLQKKKKTVKEEFVRSSSLAQERLDKLKECSESLADAQESLSTAIEAHFVKTGAFKIVTADGYTVVPNRKFGFGSKQLELF